MSFAAILGQDGAVATLRRAVAAGRVHHAYRFEGPDGTGKERAAFALAQALVCTVRAAGESDGCGACDACRRAVTISTAEPHVPQHPDVLVVERKLYSAAILGKKKDEVQDISVEQVRKVVMSPLAYPPHEGKARVIIIRAAEELSNSAANGLLKTLEEPPQATHFVLLTSRGRELIDTIRSRTQLVRFGPLPDSVIVQILRERGVAEEVIESSVQLAAGSVSAALAAADPEASRERNEFVEAVFAAISAREADAALAVAQGRDKDKDVIRERLIALATELAARGRQEAAIDRDDARRAADRHQIVMRALRELDRNASPALMLEAMLLRMRAVTLAVSPRALPIAGEAKQPKADAWDEGATLFIVASARAQEGGPLLEVDVGDLAVRRGDLLAVELEHGRALTEALSLPRRVLSRTPFPTATRLATDEDVRYESSLREREARLFREISGVIHGDGLSTKLIRVAVVRATHRVVIYLAGDDRIDVRPLVKKLGPIVQAKLEIRHVGLRDATKVLGGVGPCGLQLCCNTFLDGFPQVGMKMVKNQGIPASPERINGVCGRLLCCLVYEEAFYRNARAALPEIGERVLTSKGAGVVRELDVLAGRARVAIDKGNVESFATDEITRAGAAR